MAWHEAFLSLPVAHITRWLLGPLSSLQNTPTTVLFPAGEVQDVKHHNMLAKRLYTRRGAFTSAAVRPHHLSAKHSAITPIYALTIWTTLSFSFLVYRRGFSERRISSAALPKARLSDTAKPPNAEQGHFLRGSRPQHGPSQTSLSPVGLELQANIRSGAVDPLSTLKDALESGDPSVELIRVCLTCYDEMRLFPLTRRKRLALIKADNVGALTLKWLWEDDNRWMQVLQYEISLFDTLAFFLVAEGFQDYVTGLIRADSPSKAGGSRWRGLVLRSLVGHKYAQTSTAVQILLLIPF